MVNGSMTQKLLNIHDILRLMIEHGSFIEDLIDFLIIALVVFMIMKQLEKTPLK